MLKLLNIRGPKYNQNSMPHFDWLISRPHYIVHSSMFVAGEIEQKLQKKHMMRFFETPCIFRESCPRDISPRLSKETLAQGDFCPICKVETSGFCVSKGLYVCPLLTGCNCTVLYLTVINSSVLNCTVLYC